MKIAFVLHGFPPELSGGTERTVEALARSMQSEGHDVFVITGSMEQAPVSQVDEFELEGLRVLRVHRDDLYFESWWKCYHPGLSATLDGIFAREKPDVVHVHHWLRLTSDVARLARARGVTVAVTVHDYFPALARVVRRMGEDGVSAPPAPAYMPGVEVAEAFSFHRRDMHDELAAAHLLLFPSAAHADGLRALSSEAPSPDDLPELPGLATPVVTPPPLLAVPARRQQPAEPGRRRLVFWGSVYPEKGVGTVLQAMQQVQAQGVSTSLVVFGEIHDGDYRAELERGAAGLAVEFRGAFQHRDLETVAADLAVLPSLCHESYGLILDEALCLGLPVLASDLPAYREHAQAGACLFYPAGDVAALAALLRDDAALAALRQPEVPDLVDAVGSARRLLAAYAGVDRSAAGPGPTAVTDRERATQLFRRAERRLWSMLQQPDPPAAPGDFLR